MNNIKNEPHFVISFPDGVNDLDKLNPQEILEMVQDAINDLIGKFAESTDFPQAIYNAHRGLKHQFERIDYGKAGFDFRVRFLFQANPATHKLCTRIDLIGNPEIDYP
jgi:hypothetical protein